MNTWMSSTMTGYQDLAFGNLPIANLKGILCRHYCIGAVFREQKNPRGFGDLWCVHTIIAYRCLHSRGDGASLSGPSSHSETVSTHVTWHHIILFTWCQPEIHFEFNHGLVSQPFKFSDIWRQWSKQPSSTVTEKSFGYDRTRLRDPGRPAIAQKQHANRDVSISRIAFELKDSANISSIGSMPISRSVDSKMLRWIYDLDTLQSTHTRKEGPRRLRKANSKSKRDNISNSPGYDTILPRLVEPIVPCSWA